MDPRNPARVRDFGLSSELAGSYAEADRAFAQALTLNPQNAEVYAERAWLQPIWRGEAGEAQAILDEA